MDVSRPGGLVAAPAWRRLALDPVTAFASGVPLLALVGLALAWRVLPALF
ncbi:hypothetical protein [Methylobacterium hispanicum]|nr:hypothetical protein [Methylobacterium hispanicum]